MPKQPPEILDYDALAAAFEESLVTTLRGNRPKIDFLETWVPDNDPRTGIPQMVDAAFEANRKQISIRVSHAMLGETAIPELVDRIRQVAEVHVEELADAVVLHFERMRAFNSKLREKSNPGDPSRDVGDGKSYVPSGRIGAPEQSGEQQFVDARIEEIHAAQAGGNAHVEVSLADTPSPDATSSLLSRAAAYGRTARKGDRLSIDLDADLLPVAAAHPSLRRALKARLDSLEYEGDLPPSGANEVLRRTRDGIAISIALAPGEETILYARHVGAKDPLARAVFDAACCIMEGLPLCEAADHIGPRLLHTLRERVIERPVRGIMHTRNAGPWMHLPSQILREIICDYQPVPARDVSFSTYEIIPPQTWRGLSADERKGRVEPLLAEYRKANGLGGDDMRLLSIGNNLSGYPTRVNLMISSDILLKDRPELLFRLERYLKDRLEGSLEVYHQEAVDKSVLRRMSGTGKDDAQQG